MTVPALKLGFTKEEFTAYCQSLGKMTWNPVAVTLHNTYLPNLKMVDDYITSKRYTPGQLIDNWWQSYIRMKWSAGPHLFIFRDKIYVATPLTMRGTHSPSFNKDHYGVELVGDYDKEILPDSIRDLAEHAIAVLYKEIGTKASDKNFHFHGEDPRTTHKGCPGKNVGKKSDWILNINKRKI